MTTLELKAFQVFKTKFTEKEAATLIEFVEESSEKKRMDKVINLATKEDLAHLESRIMKSMYTVGLIQFLAIVGSVLAIFSFMLK